MRDPIRWYWAFRHAVGVALRVRSWPSRRYMRRLQVENAELRRFQVLAVDVADSLHHAGERVGQSAPRAARRLPFS